MNWSADQLRILRALGHEPMLLATDPSFAAAPARATVATAAPANGAAAAPAGAAAALAAAIARAAAGRDLSALALDLERLRREPALKRALWPRLRALRREH